MDMRKEYPSHMSLYPLGQSGSELSWECTARSWDLVAHTEHLETDGTISVLGTGLSALLGVPASQTDTSCFWPYLHPPVRRLQLRNGTGLNFFWHDPADPRS